jgi:4-amino-4-deoxy-L-arabinose transferase
LPNWRTPWVQGAALFLLAFVLRSWSATLEDFPNLWDEQYHAAVAKSLINNPMEPRLLPNTGQELDYRDWTGNGVWLHKPPLFLWTLAGSLHLWGTTVWGLRFPSILLGSLSVLLVWALGRRFSNERAGFWGALWLAAGHFSLSLVAGRIPTDHNDVHFAFWVGLGLWTASGYMHRSTYGRAAAVGAAVGAAVLTKWLPGLWAGGVLGLWIFGSGRHRGTVGQRSLAHGILAVCVATAVALPWNAYIRTVFPTEAAYESEYNARHLTEALEGHREPLYFHATSQTDLWGWAGAFLLVLGLGAAWRTRRPEWRSLVAGVLLFFGVYTAAATKMVSFTYGISVPLALLVGCGADWVLRKADGVLRKSENPMGRIPRARYVATAALLALAFLDNGRPWETWDKAQLNTPMRRTRQRYADFFRAHAATHPGERPVFQNVPKHAVPLALFFTDGTVDVRTINAQPELVPERQAQHSSRP